MRPRLKTVGVSALVLVVIPGGLAAFRTWNLEPPTAVQSLVVDTGAVLVVAGVATHVARGESIGTCAGEGIVLAFGPCPGFVANLFAPVSAIESPLWIAYPPIAGAVLALVVDGVDVAVDYIVRVMQKSETAIGQTS